MTNINKPVETVQGTVDQVKKQLEESITRFQEINTKISHRAKFIETKEKLREASIALAKESSNFESNSFKLKLASAEYRNDELLSINNPVIVGDVIRFIMSKIDEKVKQLEVEIVG